MHGALKAQLLEKIGDLIDTGAFTLGTHVESFERAFATYCRTAESVGVASGLDALRLGLLAAGIDPGDEVIVPAETFAATFESVTQAGGVPVVVDANPNDYCLDVAATEAALTSRTRFVMPVHLYGQLADMRALMDLAQRRGLTVIEDACQAHGARRDNYGPGTLATAAFSFYPGKNLGAFGDGGALTTNDGRLANRVRALREHGQVAKYRHAYEGYTSRLDAIQALVLEQKLALLDEWNQQRRAAARFYTEALRNVGDLQLPPVPKGSNPAWHLYVIRTQTPEELAEFLARRQVATGRHYPEPPHLSAAYRRLGHRDGAFPVSEAISRECLSIPMFPGITDEQLQRVVDAIVDYF
jgi:dTDP-4-amino-4,6-dideoxygalactose transaminase